MLDIERLRLVVSEEVGQDVRRASIEHPVFLARLDRFDRALEL
jgi:hypothetical protein